MATAGGVGSAGNPNEPGLSKDLTALETTLSACSGAAITTLFVTPFDVVKTRLQMDGSGGSVKQYTGTLDCAGKMVKAEGPSALFKGLPPALVRQSTYGSLRYGLYGPIKNSMGITAGKPVPLWKKIVAGGGAAPCVDH